MIIYPIIASRGSAAYLALVEVFDGDAAAADAWLSQMATFVVDGATADELLAALQAAGSPAAVGSKLDSSPSGAQDAFNILAETHALEGDEPIPSPLATSYIFTVT